MTFHIFLDHQRQWRWFLQAANGRRIADSAEAYHSEKECIDAISLVMGTTHGTPVKFIVPGVD
jgi:uncharacterized protein YegP (UPF0339 family)